MGVVRGYGLVDSGKVIVGFGGFGDEKCGKVAVLPLDSLQVGKDGFQVSCALPGPFDKEVVVGHGGRNIQGRQDVALNLGIDVVPQQGQGRFGYLPFHCFLGGLVIQDTQRNKGR